MFRCSRGYIEAEKALVVMDILRLSSGTIANLTGFKDYRTIDKVQREFAEWTLSEIDNGHTFENWLAAWEAFKSAKN